MKIKDVISKLEDIREEYGDDILVNSYLYKEMTPVRYISVQPVYFIKDGKEESINEVFIEGDKFHDE